MTNFRNMKIEINEQQPIEDVVMELEKNGLNLNFKLTSKPLFVTFNNFGYGFFDFNPVNLHETITLTQLKEM